MDQSNNDATQTTRISWYDEERTVLLCEVFKRWTWDEAHKVIKELNDVWCSSVNHGVYTVYVFGPSAALLPYGGSAIPNIRRLINTEHPNDQLIIFANAGALVTRLINIAAQVYGLRSVVSKFRFVPTLDAALREVEMHKMGQSRPVTHSRRPAS